MTRRIVFAVAVMAALGLTVGQAAAAEATVTGPGVSATDLDRTTGPGRRHIIIAAVEPKGGTSLDKEAFPTVALPEGNGYALKAPNDEGRWEVSAYQFMPSQIIVNEGDDVTLEYVGINGAEHPAYIDGYDIAFTVKRGLVTLVQFTADKPGVFQIDCGEHHPSMRGELIVLPRG
jgi:plastocyanin